MHKITIMLTLPISVTEAQLLLLILIRVSIVLFMLPFFDSAFIPMPVRITISLMLSLIFLQYTNIPVQNIPSFSTPSLILLITQELLYGLSISICINVIFTAVKMGIEFLNGQIGFSMAQIIDPGSGISAGITTNFFYLISVLFFLLINGHIVLIRSLAESLTTLPVGQFIITPRLAQDVMQYSGTLFSTSLKIAAPVISAILLVDLAIALVGKAVPTMNLMLFGFPIKIAVGFTFLILLLGIIAIEIDSFVLSIPQMIDGITALGMQK